MSIPQLSGCRGGLANGPLWIPCRGSGSLSGNLGADSEGPGLAISWHGVQAAPSPVRTAFPAPRGYPAHSSVTVAAAGEVRTCSSDCCWLQLWLAPPQGGTQSGLWQLLYRALVSVLLGVSVGAAVREDGLALGSRGGYRDGKGAVPEWHQLVC